MKKEYTDYTAESFIDIDPELYLETNSFLKKIFNLFFIPLLNSLPNNFKHIIKKSNKAASVVIDNATNHKALEVLYSKGKMFSVSRVGSNIFQYVWFNINNSKAVRNRLKLVKREIRIHLDNISKLDKQIDVISIASGSSRAIIETVLECKYLDGSKLSITFLDKSDNAISYSKTLSAKISHLPVTMNWIQDSAGNFARSGTDKKYDIVEIVGLLDYFTDEKVVELVSGVYKMLQPGGILIASNINHNLEEKFITKVIDWPMIYKTAEELSVLVHKSGFEYNNMKVFYEPLKIHGLVVAKK